LKEVTMRRLLILIPLVLLSACTLTPARDEASPFYLPPAGSRLVLEQTLTIAAETVGVFIQGGRAVGDREVNQYYPHCRLEVRDRRDSAQTVDPDDFRVRRVRRDIQTVSNFRAGPLVRVGTGPSFFIYRTIFDLESPRQPSVRILVCQYWGHPALDNHLSIREMRRALGAVMRLELPAAEGR
jgi:hypothetical protein